MDCFWPASPEHRCFDTLSLAEGAVAAGFGRGAGKERGAALGGEALG